MFRSISLNLRKTSDTLVRAVDVKHWDNLLKERFGLNILPDSRVISPHILYRQIWFALSSIPAALIKDCQVTKVLLKSDMGPNKPYYPNHGYYDPTCKEIGLNINCFTEPDHPKDFVDQNGYEIGRGAQTLTHEFGHALDHCRGDLSLEHSWLILSGWSENSRPGLKKLIIDEPNVPKIVGEWFYHPKAEFTRFYGKRNPYDDFADCFSFYVLGMKNKIPKNKRTYFNKLLAFYYQK